MIKIRHCINIKFLEKVSPLAVPILLEIGKESVRGSGLEALLDDAEESLISEGMGI